MTRPSRLPLPASTATATPRDAQATPLYQPFAGHPPALVEGALARLLASKTFRRSERHRRFLRHVVGGALNGRHDALKEVVIGLEVFDRRLADYDPREDPIVRVEAGRVREKLARYYASEGSADAFEIRIPVGGYLPQLSRRETVRAPRSLGSFAVLPFTSLSSNADDALFCDALTDQLIDGLSRVPGVRVVARVSAFAARDRSVDVRVVGRLLGVATVIEGSVQRAGSRVRCIARLVRTHDRACTWSQRFEHDAGDDADLFAFQDRIADAVVAAIGSASSTDRPVRRGRGEARDLYERARYLIQRRSLDGFAKGIALLERSIAIEPDFAPAHSQLGLARGMYYGLQALPTLPAFGDVERCARRALELDPRDGDALALLANIAFRVELDWAKAEPMFREALRHAPNSSSAHQSYAAALVFNGRYLEALEHARIALDLDPLNITMRIHLAVITAYARDFDTAIDELRSVLDADPDHFFSHFMLGSILLWAGDADGADRHFDIAMRLEPTHPIPQFDSIFVAGFRGEHARGRQRLAALLARLDGQHYQQYNRAMAESFLDDVDAMCATLRRTAAARELLFCSLPADPSFDRHRNDPAFVALVAEYGLPTLPPSPFASPVPRTSP